MQIDIPENLITLTPRVTEAFVTLQVAPDVEFPARIAEIGTEASSTTRTYPLKLRFAPPENLEGRAGMTGSARGRGDPPSAEGAEEQSVPTTAVSPRRDPPGGDYDPEAKTVHSRPVQILTTTPRAAGVGLKTMIVVTGVHYLEE